MKLILTVYLAFLSIAIVDLITITTVCKILKIGIKEVGLFRFSKLTTFNIQEITVALGLIPFPGSYIQFISQENTHRNSHVRIFESLPIVTKLLISLSGIAVNILIASLILGFSQAVMFTGEGIVQIVKLIVNHDIGLHYLEQTSELLQNNWWYTWTILTTKVIAFNLLPVPSLYGGFVLVTIWESLTRSKISPDLLSSLTLLSILMIATIFLVAWGEIIYQIL